MEEIGGIVGKFGKSYTEVFVRLFNELSPKDREHVIHVLENVSKEAIKSSETLGKEGIGAAKEVLEKAVESIQTSFKTISDNRTNRILARIEAEKSVKETDLDTVVRLAEMSTQNGGSDEPRRIYEIHHDAEIKKRELILQEKRMYLDTLKEAVLGILRNAGLPFISGLGSSILPMLLQSGNQDERALVLAKAYQMVRDFPVNDFPQLAPYVKMVDMCVSRNSKLLPMAIELTEGEIQKVRDSLE